MDNDAKELSQLSRILFDKAALHWQLAILLSFLSGLVSLFISIVAPSFTNNVIFAGLAAVILLIGYWFRFSFERIQDIAETMRRQSALSEGLGWSIKRNQFVEWRQLAGKKLIERVAASPRSDDYYETKSAIGPARLAAMTFESLYWTRSLYRKVRNYLLIVIVLTALVLISVLSVVPLIEVSHMTRVSLVYFFYLLIPVLVSVDLIGMVVRLNRGIAAFTSIASSLESLENAASADESEVLRIVSEYNCSLAAGLPIPRWVFDRHHAEIEACWGS